MVAAALRGLGFEVEVAEDGAALRSMLARADETGELPDLIVSDHHMPGVHGLDLLREMGSNGHAQIPFIVITAFGDAETHRRASELGAYAVFDKPFDLLDLAQAVEAAVEAQ